MDSTISRKLVASVVSLAISVQAFRLFRRFRRKQRAPKLHHVLSIDDIDRETVERVLELATFMESVSGTGAGLQFCRGKVLANLFLEPSTRTSCSFQAAMLRLGGQVITINDPSTSSVKKGETLEDTVRSLASYCDVVVLRHPDKGSATRAAKALDSHSGTPLLNAGDGAGEHPTQALLDVYTIFKELGRIDGLTVSIVGDLKHGRTVHSLVKLLANFTDITIKYVSPESLSMPDSLQRMAHASGITQSEHRTIEEVIACTDVLYVTRIQKERFESEAAYNQVKDSFMVVPETLANAKQSMVVMHPLPRVNEISPAVDSDPRAAYFRQMQNGMFVRMALLAAVMDCVR